MYNVYVYYYWRLFFLFLIQSKSPSNRWDGASALFRPIFVHSLSNSEINRLNVGWKEEESILVSAYFVTLAGEFMEDNDTDSRH